MENKITKVQKRDGSIVDFDQKRIEEAIFKALTATNEGDGKKAKRLAQRVVDILNRRFKKKEIPHVEQIQDIVEEVLILEGLVKTAKAYILYREQRRRIREAIKVSEEAVDRLDQYLEKLDWEVQENANMAFSLQGLNHYGVSYIVKKYWLNKIYPPEIREANESGDFHIHNLDTLATYCCGWDLYDLLLKGFGGVPGKVESKPAKHFRTALGQLVNFFYTLQGECYSSDTQVLTESGWKYFYEVTQDDRIFTLNTQTNEIELQKPIKFYEFDYDGELYNFKSKKLDLLVTPNHNMVVDQYSPKCKGGNYYRKFVKAKDFNPNEHFIPKGGIWKGKKKKWFVLPGIKIYQYRNFSNSNNFSSIFLNSSPKAFLQKVEKVESIFGKVLSLPKAEVFTSQPLFKYEIKEIKPKKILMDDWLKFFGFWLAEGSTTLRRRNRKGRKNPYYEYQIRISQNEGKTLEEFEKVLKKLPFHYRKKINKKNPKKVTIEITDKQLFLYLRKFGKGENKFIPKEIKELPPTQLKILFNWLMKGNGYVGNGNIEYYTKSKRLADDIQEIVLKLGWSANIYKKYKNGFEWFKVGISRNKHFRLKSKERNIRKIKYQGKVYCLEVPNHTLYVRRNGKACWCGNSAGAQAVSNFDTLLAPFIRYDNLNYQQVKQALQEFLFNMAIPTRVGFQSLAWDELVVIKHRGKIKFIEIGKLIDEEFEKNSHRIIEQHPQSFALENHDDYYTLSFDSQGKAIWAKVKAFIRHRVPKNSQFIKVRTNRGEVVVSPGHSLFSFRSFNKSFNPKVVSASEIKIAKDWRHLNEKNHLLALSKLENKSEKEEIDLVELIDEFPQLHKNVFVRINPTHTLSKIRENIFSQYQRLHPFYVDFGIRDKGVWKDWLKKKSIRYDIWRKFGDLSNKNVKFKLKNSKIWYPRILKGEILENFVKLLAWYIGEGHKGLSVPVFISQANQENKKEIKKILRRLKCLGKIEKNKGYSKKGNKVQIVEKITAKGLLAEIVSLSGGVMAFNKVIPWFIFDLSKSFQKIFLETLNKGEGVEYKDYWQLTTTSKKLCASLSLLLALNDIRFSIYCERKKTKKENWHDKLIIRIFKPHAYYGKKQYKVGDFEARVCLGKEKVKYEREFEYDISVDLPQENFAGGVGLLMFHNSPFSNITLDLKPSPTFAKLPVIIGGKPQDKTYSEFEEEMKIFDKALYEVYMEGDAKGRPFHFPIPTINITKDFPWDEPAFNGIFEASAKYGINYFANYINSEMKPEDVRSMCLEASEEILIRNSQKIRRLSIKEVAESYKEKDFDKEGWAECKKEGNLEVLSLNPKTLKLEWTPVKRFLKIVDDKGVEITTEDGKKSIFSLKHPIPTYTPEGIRMKWAKDVHKGDFLLTLKKANENIFTKEYQKIDDLILNEDLAKILGYFVADGNYLFENKKGYTHFGQPRGLQFSFKTGDLKNLNLIKSLIKKVFSLDGREKQDPRYNTYYLYIYNSEIARKLYKAGFKKYGRLPQVLFNSPPEVIKSFLDFYFKGDGYEKRKEIHLNDLELSRDLVLLFSLIGQPVTYRRKKSQVIYLQHAKEKKYNTLTKENLKIKNSDVYLIRVKEVKIRNYKKPKEFYDVELEKNHLFVHSLGQISFNCCRLRLDLTELYNRGGGGLFGSGSLTGCYDEKTEILTENGWKLFKDLTLNDRVFTLSQDNKIELHHPTKLFEYDYEGEMIKFSGKAFDLLVTPNHRMVVDHKYKLKRMFVEAKDFKKWQHLIPKGGIWEGEEKEYFELPPVVILQGTGPQSRFSEKEILKIRRMKEKGISIYQLAEDFNCNPVTIYNICTKENYGNKQRVRVLYEAPPLKIKMDDWLKFFGFWIAEGSTDNEKIAPSHGYRVVISQANEKKRKEVKKILDALPFNYYEEGPNLVICNKQLWNYLRQFGNKYTKFIPKEIKNLSKRQLKILLDWMMKGDGHIRKTGQMNYWTCSKKLADDIQEIALKLGWLAVIRERKNKISSIKGRKVKTSTCYEISFHWKTKHFVFNKKRKIEKVFYRGKVYCCEVPNHTVYVRRNGNPTWCGNSIGVVTINLPRIGYLSKTKKEFFERLAKVMDLAKESLEIKRKVLENFIEKGLYPYSRYYLQGIKQMRGKYWANHFSTIGLVGMNECLLNFMGENIASKRGRKFALEVLDFMRERLVKYQKETGNLYNLEATPAESSLAPSEKVLISQSDPKLVKIGPLIDRYLEKNKEKIQIVGKSEVLPLPEGELFTFGFSRKDQKIRKYPVTALIRHPGDSMYLIETISGRKVKVTKYHSVFTLSEQGIPKEVKVSELKKGDVIAVPRKIEMETQYLEFNLIKEFKKCSKIKKYLYLKTTPDFIEKLILKEEVKTWAKRYYKFPWKDVKSYWRKKKIIPLKLIFDLNIAFDRNTLENSRIFYRKSKNTISIKTLIKADKNLGFLLGILLAEGWVKTKKKDRIEIANTNSKIIKETIKAISNVFGEKTYSLYSKRDKRGFKKQYIIVFSKIASLVIKEIFGLKEKSGQKKLPSFIYFTSLEFISSFLKGFILGDGSKYLNKEKSDFNWRLYTNSKELLEGLNILFLRLGILTKIRVDRKDKVNPNWKRNYVLSISGVENLQKFYSLIFQKEFNGKLKNSGREVIPKIVNTLKDLIKRYNLRTKDLEELGIHKDSFNRNVRVNRISRQYLKEILEKIGEKIKNPLIKNLKVLIEGDLYWDPIKSIRKIKTPKYVYDFEVNVKGDFVENFLGGQGLVCLHNTAYRLALKDKEKYPDIITAGTKKVPYYTNSTQLPVNYTDDVFEALKLQEELQCKYTGGTVFHIFLGEKMPNGEAVKKLVKKIFENFKLPYITITPTFSICPVHGYLSGEYFYCPKCTVKQPCEVYSRIVGYLRPVQQWNLGKQQEFKQRKEFKIRE